MDPTNRSTPRTGARGAHGRPLWLKRALSQRSLLVATAAAILVVTAVLSAIVGLAARAPATGVRETLASTPFSSGSAVLGMQLADSPAKQDAAVARLLAAQFGSAPLALERTVVSDTWPLADGSPGTTASTDSPTVIFLDDDAVVAQRVRTVAGSLSAVPASPAGPGDGPQAVAIDSTGARALKVGVGDTIRLQLDARILVVRVSGVFAARSSVDLGWVAASTGVDGSSARLLASPALIDALGSAATVRYAIAPRAASAEPDDLPNYDRGFRTFASAAERVPAFDGLSPTVTGSGRATITAIRDSLVATDAVVPVPIAIVAVSALIALILLAQLLAVSRDNETRLLLARGGSLGTLARASAVETMVVAGAGVVAGLVAAQVVLALAVGPPSGPAEVIVPAAATLVVALACGVTVAFVSASRASGAPRPDSGRGRVAGSASIAILLLAAAAVTIWRFVSYGVPAPGSPADPIGVFAPAAALCALAMVALVALGPIARRVERLVGRSVGMDAVLPARQIGRSLGLFSAPVALLVLAVGGSSFAATYVGTWSTFLAGSARLVTGSDISIAVDTPPTVGSDPTPIDVAGFSSIDGVTASAPVLTTNAQVGDQSVALVAVAADRLPSLAAVDPRMLNAGAVRRSLLARVPTGAVAGVALPAGSTAVTLKLTTAEDTSVAGVTARPTLWVEDAVGDLVPLSLPEVRVPAADATTTAKLPAGGAWRAVALDVDIHTTAELRGVAIAVTGVDVTLGGAQRVVPLGSSNWVPQSQVFGVAAQSSARGSALGRFVVPAVSGDQLDSSVRLMPKYSGRVPVVIGKDTAAVLGLRVGDPIDFDGDWSSFPARVAGIVPVVPGATDAFGAIADLPTMQSGALRVSASAASLDTVWIAARDAPRAQAAVARVAGSTATVTVASGALSSRFLSSAVVGLWLGAFGASAFALVALAGAIGATARRRAGEVAVLRAVGMSARQQGAARRTEIAAITGYAVVCGIASGVIVSLIAASTLARLSVSFAPRVLPIPLGVDLPMLAIALLALWAAVVAVTVWFVRAVRHRAAEPATRGGE